MTLKIVKLMQVADFQFKLELPGLSLSACIHLHNTFIIVDIRNLIYIELELTFLCTIEHDERLLHKLHLSISKACSRPQKANLDICMCMCSACHMAQSKVLHMYPSWCIHKSYSGMLPALRRIWI